MRVVSSRSLAPTPHPSPCQWPLLPLQPLLPHRRPSPLPHPHLTVWSGVAAGAVQAGTGA